MIEIKNNLEIIQSKIVKACERSGRNPAELEIIAVTKTIDIESIDYALDCGINSIGENKVQEIMDKYPKIQKPVKWHLIGHLQTNKVKYIIDKVDLIHSLDSISLAEEINKRAAKLSLIKDVLIQVNVAEEESKFGIGYDEVDSFIEQLQGFDNIRVRGFMTIAPYFEDPEQVRPYFRRLKQKFDEYQKKELKGNDIEFLSMGMTNDYEVAAEEGANLLRIGTGIFGARNYNV